MLFEEFYIKNHVMIDIETLAKSTNSVITQLSAVQFCPITGETGLTFDRKISIQSCLDAGLIIDESTLKFWLSQDKEAINKVYFSNDIEISIEQVLGEFNKFIKMCSSTDKFVDTRVWGNGPSFDLAKLSGAYQHVNGSTQCIPWGFFNERCVRTIVAMAPWSKKNAVFTGIKHDGISDCHHQIKYIAKTFSEIINWDRELAKLPNVSTNDSKLDDASMKGVDSSTTTATNDLDDILKS